MELKDGKIIASDEEKGLLNSTEGKKWLIENKFMVEVEKKFEVEKPLTDEVVSNYILKNQGFSDKLYNENSLKFLKSKLGKEVSINDLGKDLISKDDFNSFKSEAIKTAVSFGLNTLAPKHSALLLGAIDLSKIDIKDGKLTGFDEQINTLKTTYPDLFNSKEDSQTPPALGTNNGNSKITKEQFSKMTYAERVKLMNEDKATYDELIK